MSRTIQARLDEETARLLAELRRRTGLSNSELVRKGIEALSLTRGGSAPKRIRGLGKFASGQSDLATCPDALDGFGSS